MVLDAETDVLISNRSVPFERCRSHAAQQVRTASVVHEQCPAFLDRHDVLDAHVARGHKVVFGGFLSIEATQIFLGLLAFAGPKRVFSQMLPLSTPVGVIDAGAPKQAPLEELTLDLLFRFSWQ